MNQEKIQQIEEEIKKIFLDNSDENWNVFWSIHVKPVIEKSKELAEKYGGDLEVIWLAAILHDLAQLEVDKDHDVVGAQKAYDLLTEKGFDEDIAEKVKNVIFTHRVREYKPENLEQKILATADAVCHFTKPHYFWMAHISKKSFMELIKKFDGKIDRDFNDKIFFEDEKKLVEEQYKILKNWFKIN